MSEDYYYIGQMVCIALLQNGQLPVYIPVVSYIALRVCALGCYYEQD